MNATDSFKALINKKKITRVDWNKNEYIEYDERINAFVLHYSNDLEDFCSKPYFHGELNPYISFIGDETDRVWTLYDDDKNEIYISEEEKMKLDAMRFRLMLYCDKATEDACSYDEEFGVKCSDGCKLSAYCHEGNGEGYFRDLIYMNMLKQNEIKEMYNAIKEI